MERPYGSETAEDGEAEARFITDIEVIAANDGDSEVLGEIQERLIGRGLKPDEHFVDRGYVSGPNLANSHGRGIELVGPALADTSPKPQGYKQGDFDIDFEACQATCPQGRTAEAWRPYRECDGWTRIEVIFGSQCHDCPARDLCAPGKKGRKLSLSPFYHYLYQRRAEQETEAFKDRMKRRAAIEGTISELTRKHGARRARYRGKAKVRLQMLFSGAAANLKRLARAMEVRSQAQAQANAHTTARR